MKFEQDAWSKREESLSRIIKNSAKAMTVENCSLEAKDQ